MTAVLAIIPYFLGSQRKLALSLWMMWEGEHFESTQFLIANIIISNYNELETSLVLVYVSPVITCPEFT